MATQLRFWKAGAEQAAESLEIARNEVKAKEDEIKARNAKADDLSERVNALKRIKKRLEARQAVVTEFCQQHLQTPGEISTKQTKRKCGQTDCAGPVKQHKPSP